MFAFCEGLLLLCFRHVHTGCCCRYCSTIVAGASPVAGTALFCAPVAFLVVWNGVFSSSTSVRFVRSSSVGKVEMTAKCSLTNIVTLASIARCSFRAIADAGATFLITKSTGGSLFSALSCLYWTASITILGVDKRLGLLGLVDTMGTIPLAM